jgi:hypothetical protein
MVAGTEQDGQEHGDDDDGERDGPDRDYALVVARLDPRHRARHRRTVTTRERTDGDRPWNGR